MPDPVEQELYTTEDFTFFPRNGADKVLLAWLIAEDHKTGEKFSETGTPAKKAYELTLTLRDPRHNRRNPLELSGRALACRTGVGEDWSVTFRRTGKLTEKMKAVLKPVKNAGVHAKLKSGWRASQNYHSDYLNSRSDVVEALFGKIFLNAVKRAPAQGLLAVFGATSSGKNWTSRGLLHQYLTSPSTGDYFRRVKKRRPHLVTFEDPIEEPFWYPGDKKDGGLDYTPREHRHSADTLEEVTRSALRQTPAAVYISETRSLPEWRRLLEFAGTGHFVTTTGHAGSLAEAVGIVLASFRADTPAKRKDVASRLVAVAHLRPVRISTHVRGERMPRVQTVLLPALWLGTEKGQYGLMAQGRGSIVPEEPYCFGRYEFAQKLLDSAMSRNRQRVEIRDSVMEQFLRDVLQADLEGL